MDLNRKLIPYIPLCFLQQLNRIMFNLKQRRRKQHHRLLSLQAGAGAAQGGPARIRRPPTTNNFRSRHRKLRMQQRQQQQQQRQPLFPPPPQVGSTRRPLDFLREQTLGRYQASKSNSFFCQKKNSFLNAQFLSPERMDFPFVDPPPRRRRT